MSSVAAPGGVIRTERLLLKTWRDDDGDALPRLVANPQVMADVGRPVNREVSDQRLAAFPPTYRERGFSKWGVEHDGAFIGCCGVMPSGPGQPLGDHLDVGWRLLPQS